MYSLELYTSLTLYWGGGTLESCMRPLWSVNSFIRTMWSHIGQTLTINWRNQAFASSTFWTDFPWSASKNWHRYWLLMKLTIDICDCDKLTACLIRDWLPCPATDQWEASPGPVWPIRARYQRLVVSDSECRSFLLAPGNQWLLTTPSPSPVLTRCLTYQHQSQINQQRLIVTRSKSFALKAIGLLVMRWPGLVTTHTEF